MAEKSGAESLTPFWHISNLADEISNKYDLYVNAGVHHRSYSGGICETEYCYYDERSVSGTVAFKTSMELIQYMQKKLNPPKDKGVAV